MFTDLISEFQEDITAVESFADEIYPEVLFRIEIQISRMGSYFQVSFLHKN